MERATEGLGDRIRQKRREKGWTQQRLAEEVQASQAVIQKIENGKSLRPRNVENIARALGVSPAWLLFGELTVSDLTLSDEAVKVAISWSRLSERERDGIKDAILSASIRENLTTTSRPEALSGEQPPRVER